MCKLHISSKQEVTNTNDMSDVWGGRTSAPRGSSGRWRLSGCRVRYRSVGLEGDVVLPLLPRASYPRCSSRLHDAPLPGQFLPSAPYNPRGGSIRALKSLLWRSTAWMSVVVKTGTLSDDGFNHDSTLRLELDELSTWPTYHISLTIVDDCYYVTHKSLL